MGELKYLGRTEIELVLEAQYGDLEAFDALVARYRHGAVILARQILRTQEMAEDAVQDSFLAAYKALPQLADPGSFAHWFGAIVRHRAQRIAVGEMRNHLPLDELILSHAPSISAEIEANDTSKSIRCAVTKLSDEIRPTIELYYLQEWRVAQIAAFLALPVSTVKWRLHTGRRQLRSMLSQQLEESNGSGK